jgi:hypothetical protein
MRSLAFLILLAIGAAPAVADSGVSDEAQLRAAFVYKLMRFVVWPNPGAQNSALVVCYSSLNIDDELALLKLEQKSIQGRMLRVLRTVNPAQLSSCNTLVMGESVPATITDALPARGMLTIGGRESLHQGGSVALTVANDAMTMMFNDTNIKQSQLEIPAPVLALGAHVH